MPKRKRNVKEKEKTERKENQFYFLAFFDNKKFFVTKKL